MEIIKTIVGGVLLALGGAMLFACVIMFPVVWNSQEYFVARLVTHLITLGMFTVVTWTGWRWVRRKPSPGSVPQLASASSSLPIPPQQPAIPNVTVVLQNAPQPSAGPTQIIHIRCSHCGTTTPESERQCGQCGAALR